MNKTYVIANLNLFKDGDDTKSTIDKNWNKVVSEDDVVIVMGPVGVGSFNEMKSVISRLNGEKLLYDYSINQMFTKDEWKEIGFKYCWNTPMFNELPNGELVFYVLADDSVHTNEDCALFVTSTNHNVGDVKNYFIPDADTFDFCPIDADEVVNVYNNMMAFESMPNTIETRSEVKELEWGDVKWDS